MEDKGVIVLSDTLPIGLKSNIAAVMGMSLGRYRPDLVGPMVKTADGTELPGITTIPVPVLTADEDTLARLFVDARDLEIVVPFGTAALTTKNYADYQAKLEELTDSEQGIRGLLLLGPKKPVNKLVGQLALLR
jgi:hypothetical protein